jgi:hypothetical protein
MMLRLMWLNKIFSYFKKKKDNRHIYDDVMVEITTTSHSETEPPLRL